MTCIARSHASRCGMHVEVRDSWGNRRLLEDDSGPNCHRSTAPCRQLCCTLRAILDSSHHSAYLMQAIIVHTCCKRLRVMQAAACDARGCL